MKKACIIAAVLLVAGLALLIAAFASVWFRFRNLGTINLETRTYAVTKDFENIQIEETTADIIFTASMDGACSVICREPEKVSHTVRVEDGTLKIGVNQANWTDFMGLSFESRTTTVYLPKETYESLSVRTQTGYVDLPEGMTFQSIDITGSTGGVCCRANALNSVAIRMHTGDISLEGVSAGTIDCTVTTGKVRIQSVSCDGDMNIKVTTGEMLLSDLMAKKLVSDGSTGEAQLKNVIAEEITIERGTGDVKLDNSDANTIRIKTTTGDVTGSLRTGKTFITKTSTGDVRVPQSVSGGRCEITTTTGDIHLSISDKE